MQAKRISSLLSLCQKAGKLTTGEFGCENALRKGEAYLIIICCDASDNTKKKFINKAFYYKVEAVVYGSSEELSKAIGKSNRMVYAVADANFAQAISKLISESTAAESNGEDKP